MDEERKWCPEVRFFLTVAGAVVSNRGVYVHNVDHVQGYTYCIGDRCAVWVSNNSLGSSNGRCGLVKK